MKRLFVSLRAKADRGLKPAGAVRRRRENRLRLEPLELRTPVSASILGVLGAALVGDLLGYQADEAVLAGEPAGGVPRTSPSLSAWEDRQLDSILPGSTQPAEELAVASTATAETDGQPNPPDQAAFGESVAIASSATSLDLPQLTFGSVADDVAQAAAFAGQSPGLVGAQSIFSDVVCASAGVASAGGLGGENSSSAPGEPGALNASSGDSPSARTPAGMSLTVGDDVPQNGAAPDGADNWAADQLALLSADSSHSKNGGPVASASCCCGGGGCCCPNTAPYLANTGCGCPPPPPLPSEVYLNAALGDTNEIILPDYFRDNQQAPETLVYSTQPPAGNCVTTEIVMVGGDATLRFHSTGNTGSTTVTARATDNGGLFYNWSFTVYACRVTGYQVQERAWGQNTWSAPEDGGADWKLLWTHNQYRWKPLVSAEATGHVTSHSWDFTNATWCKGVCSYGAWDPWAYGNPSASGPFTVTPRVNFGSVIDTYYTRSASASLVAAPQPNADQPRLSMHQISSLAWQEVPYSQTFVDPDDSTSHNLGELQYEEPYWKALPDYGTPDMNEVRAILTVGPAIPAGMGATLYVTWYDPLNVLANVTPPPPAGAPAHTLRDNVTSMTPAGGTFLFAAGKQSRNVYFGINDARLGDNFVLAAHPNYGIEMTYTFGPGSGCGCGCGAVEVLKYEDYPPLNDLTHPNKPNLDAPKVKSELQPNLRTPTLHVIPSMIDIDSNNSKVIDGSDPPIEDDPTRPGKCILLNNNDDDVDGIVDSSDFNVRDSNFAELTAVLPVGVNPNTALVKFAFDPGKLRIWTCNGLRINSPLTDTENPGNIVPANEAFVASKLFAGGPKTLYVEGLDVNGAQGLDRILLWLDPDGAAGPLGFVARDAVRTTVVKLAITSQRGLYKPDGSYVSTYMSEDNFGRVYNNRRYDPAAPAQTIWTKNRQYVDFVLQVYPLNVILPPAFDIGATVEDVDDPSNDPSGGVSTEAGRVLDPSDYDAGGNYVGKIGNDDAGTTDGQPAVEPTPGFVPSRNGEFGRRFNVTDVGGSNYTVRFDLRYLPEVPSGGQKTGIMTTWTKIQVEYDKMPAAQNLSFQQLNTSFEKAFVEFAVEPVTQIVNKYFYLDDTGDGVPDHWYFGNNRQEAETKFQEFIASPGNGGFFDHRGQGGWFYFAAADRFDFLTVEASPLL